MCLIIVVPNMISHGPPRQFCIVFGHAVLFRLFDRTGENATPTPMRESIMRARQDLGARNLLEEGCNPIRRRPLIVVGYDTEVMIYVMEVEGDDDEGGGIGANVDSLRSAMVCNQEVCLLSSQILHLRRELCDAQTEGHRQHYYYEEETCSTEQKFDSLCQKTRNLKLQAKAVRQHAGWRRAPRPIYW